MIDLCRRIAAHRGFHNAILLVIVLNAVLIGVETSRELSARYGGLLRGLNLLVQVIFVAEILARLLAHAPRVHRFFGDGWNVFDFAVVALSLLPAAGPFATVARLARVLRVARLISAWPELRLIVATMLKSIPSMGHVIMLLGLLIYIYAVLGVHLFGARQPEHFGTLGTACLSLFQVLTLEGWADMQAASLAYNRWAWLYYGSFVVVAVFVVINLFIAVVTNNLQAAKAEVSAEAPVPGRNGEVLLALQVLRQQVDALETAVRADAERSRR